MPSNHYWVNALRVQLASEHDADIDRRVYSLYIHLFYRLHIIIDYRYGAEHAE